MNEKEVIKMTDTTTITRDDAIRAAAGMWYYPDMPPLYHDTEYSRGVTELIYELFGGEISRETIWDGARAIAKWEYERFVSSLPNVLMSKKEANK